MPFPIHLGQESGASQRAELDRFLCVWSVSQFCGRVKHHMLIYYGNVLVAAGVAPSAVGASVVGVFGDEFCVAVWALIEYGVWVRGGCHC